MDGKLCREHAITLQLELQGSPIERMIGAIDREITKSRDPVVQAFGDLISSFFSGAQSPSSQQPPPRQQQRSGPRPPPRQPPPPRAAPANPELEARKTLGFAPDAKLTRELVKERKRALGLLFHPDKQGSTDAMAAVNNAADVLLAKLP